MPDHSPLTETLVRSSAERPAGFVGVAGASSDQPVLVRAWPWWKMVLVRAARVYSQTWVGLQAVQMSGVADLTKLQPFEQQWSALATITVLSVAPSIATLMQNAAEFFLEWDTKAPKWRS